MTTFGITGHQQAPPDVWSWIKQRLSDRLAGEADLHGITSLAAGADQLFATLIYKFGGTLTVVLPCRGYETTFEKPEDRARFDSLLASASSVRKLAYAKPSEAAYMAAGKCVAESCDVLLAVWDGKPARGLGGTADVVDYARSLGRTVEIIWPERNLATN